MIISENINMTTVLQPLTLQVTATQLRLRSQLHAVWPRTIHGARKARAIHAITKYIRHMMPDDYEGELNVFLSNEAEDALMPEQGFIYNLVQQSIVTRPVHGTDQAALLYIHYETALAMGQIDNESDNESDTEIPLSRIEQIKQWQKETARTVLQCMADTALSMEAQTALRGAMAGLNKLGALLNKAGTITANQTRHATRQAMQKTVTRDIASILSDVRSSLNVAGTNGITPPTKAQLAVRAQLSKLDKMLPAHRPRMTKPAPVIKAAAPVTAIQKPKARTAAIRIKAMRAIAVTKLARSSRAGIRVVPRLVTVPLRAIARISARPQQRTAAASQRFSLTVSKPMLQKLLVALRTPPISPIQRKATHFQISRPAMAARRLMPPIMRLPIAQLRDSTLRGNARQAPLPLQAKAPIIPQRLARQPAHYAAMATSVAAPRQIAHKAITIAIAPFSVRHEIASLPIPVTPAAAWIKPVIHNETVQHAMPVPEKIAEKAVEKTAEKALVAASSAQARSLIEKLRGAQQDRPISIEAHIKAPKIIISSAPMVPVSDIIVPQQRTAPPITTLPESNIIPFSRQAIHTPQARHAMADAASSPEQMAIARGKTGAEHRVSNVIQFKRPAIVSPIQKLRDSWMDRERHSAGIGTLAFAGSRVAQPHAVHGDRIGITPIAPPSSPPKERPQGAKKKVAVLKIGICGPC